MKYVNLGKSGLKVSQLCLGTMMFGGATNEQDSVKIVHRSLDDGINFIDTANGYNNGLSEEIVGKALLGRRNEVVLTTKVNASMGNGPNDGGLSRYHILQEVENSLRRLQTDHIDVYMLHRPDPLTPLEESLESLGILLSLGKIRYIGMSNHKAWQVRDALAILDALRLPQVSVVQDLYNMFNRDIEVELLPFCGAFGVGSMVYSPLARGVLTGKYLSGDELPAGSRAARGDDRIHQTELRDESLNIVGDLMELSKSHDKTLSQFALNWVIGNPLVSSAVIGPRTFDQYEDNLGAVGWDITEDALLKIDDLIPPGEHTGKGFNDPLNPVTGRPKEIKI